MRKNYDFAKANRIRKTKRAKTDMAGMVLTVCRATLDVATPDIQRQVVMRLWQEFVFADNEDCRHTKVRDHWCLQCGHALK